MFDEFLNDVKAIGKELSETRKIVKSSINELTGDVTGIKKDVQDTIDTVKSEATKTVDDVKKSLAIKPDTKSGDNQSTNRKLDN